MLAFDIDGIVLNTSDGAIKKFNEMNGTALRIEYWTQYSFEKCFNFPRALIKEAFELYIEESKDNPVFFDGAIETLKLCEKEFGKLIFITNRQEKEAMIAKHQIEAALNTAVIIYPDDQESKACF